MARRLPRNRLIKIANLLPLRRPCARVETLPQAPGEASDSIGEWLAATIKFVKKCALSIRPSMLVCLLTVSRVSRHICTYAVAWIQTCRSGPDRVIAVQSGKCFESLSESVSRALPYTYCIPCGIRVGKQRCRRHTHRVLVVPRRRIVMLGSVDRSSCRGSLRKNVPRITSESRSYASACSPSIGDAGFVSIVKLESVRPTWAYVESVVGTTELLVPATQAGQRRMAAPRRYPRRIEALFSPL